MLKDTLQRFDEKFNFASIFGKDSQSEILIKQFIKEEIKKAFDEVVSREVEYDGEHWTDYEYGYAYSIKQIRENINKYLEE